METQKGFTLVELVMVIVILGILSATALPKFVNLGGDARTAAIAAVEGSMRSANAAIYAKAAVANQMAYNGTVMVNGVSVPTRYGYATTVGTNGTPPTGLVAAMDLTAKDFDTAAWNQIRHSGARDLNACRVVYVAATFTAGTPANPTGTVNPPTYTQTVTGC